MEKVKKEENSKTIQDTIIERNIRTLVERRKHEEDNRSIKERVASVVTAFTANMAFIYTNASVFAVWIFWNIGLFGLKPFDPSFTGLMLTTAIESMFLTTFVLMNQRSLDAQADKRADLDLHISLLSEHETTKIITLVKAIAKKLEIPEANAPEIDNLSQDVLPETIIDIMEQEKRDKGL